MPVGAAIKTINTIEYNSQRANEILQIIADYCQDDQESTESYDYLERSQDLQDIACSGISVDFSSNWD